MDFVFRWAAVAAFRMPRGLLDFLLGTVLLRWGFFRHPLRRRIILANYGRILRHQGAEPDPERLRALLRETQPLYARLLISMLARPEDVEFARRHVDLERILPELEKARAKGRGVILACSNFGLFTAMIQALALRGYSLRIPILNRQAVKHMPYGWADSFLTVGKSSKECLDALARNDVVVVITMVNFLARRPTLELFGAPARLGYAPARLAESSGAPILPAFALFENGECRVLTDGAIELEPGPEAVERTTARLARVQEKYIGRYPAQWQVYEDFWDLRWMDANYRFTRWFLRWF